MTRNLKYYAAFLFSAIFSVASAQMQRTVSQPMPSRQVHLDFHTSELIPGIGERFNKKQFQEALKIGHVNQVNIFAKCHHSWSYYPTVIGKEHPNLKFDLLGAQMEACHEIGVKAPIYFTIGWSATEAELHPEWCIRKKDGSIYTLGSDLNAAKNSARPFYSWKCLDASVNSPYHRYVLTQIEEICKRYKELDGFWFDIYHIAATNYNQYALERMRKEGIDIDDETAVAKSQALALKAHMQALRELVAKYHPDATVFFNTATRVNNKDIFKERLYDLNTHQDLEDLPTTWGGYDKLPIEAKFHLQQNVAVTAMSGKFHKAWGEFGGFKNKEAIKYEAAAMISFGASCNFGDQLHPSGEMDLETYKNIGYAYEYVKKIEQYGPGGIPVSNLGVWLTLKETADRGVVNMLLELHKDFIFANEANLDKLSVVIIPSYNVLTMAQAKTINAWVKKGGKLIVFGDGAMDKNGKEFIIDINASYLGKSDFQFDYTAVKSKEIARNIVSTPFLNYESGMKVKLNDASSTILAAIRNPYFNRTYAEYSGHRETPYQLTDSEYPAIIRNEQVVFFAHNLDQLYFTHGVWLHRELFRNAIDMLQVTPMLTVNNLPSAGRVSFLKQEQQKRYIAHLLYSPPLLRGEVTVIEDFVPVPNVKLEVKVTEKIKKVIQIPENKIIPFTQSGGSLKITIPTFTMHTGIVFEY